MSEKLQVGDRVHIKDTDFYGNVTAEFEELRAYSVLIDYDNVKYLVLEENLSVIKE